MEHLIRFETFAAVLITLSGSFFFFLLAESVRAFNRKLSE